MKKYASLLIITYICQQLTAQGIHVKLTFPGKDGKQTTIDTRNGQNLETTIGLIALTTFTINCDDLPTGDKLIVTNAGESFDYKVKSVDQAMTFKNSILSSDIVIKHFDGKLTEIIADKITFQIVPATATIVQSVHTAISYTDQDGNPVNVDVVDGKDLTVAKDASALKEIKISSKDLPAGDKLTIAAVNESFDLTVKGTEQTFTFKTDLIGAEITIKHVDKGGSEVKTDQTKFHIIRASAITGTTNNQNQPPSSVVPSISDYLKKNYDNMQSTPFGLIDPNDKNHVIHIFFDDQANSLLSTVPSGISNAQYMVHIIYPFSSANPDAIRFSVKQKTGSYSSALLFNNTDIRSSLSTTNLQAGQKVDGVTEKRFLLATATDDLSFDITASPQDGSTPKKVLDSYTIKMSPTYHGSFDVGLLRTDLSNPTYALTKDPLSADSVVKQTDESPKMIVSVMATFYVSPIVLLEDLINPKNKTPFYKKTGRNFLDDHKIYERFYPTIGVGISDKALENFFFGVNWEIARGLSVFGGWHYGKVRTFEMPGYVPEKTPVNQEQFNFYQNTRWKLAGAFGAKVDIMIIRNLFGSTTP